MAINTILILYLLFFGILAWKNFRLAVGWLILCLPAYLLRFNIGTLPTTLLELHIIIIFLIWVTHYLKTDWQTIKQIAVNNKTLFVFIGLFLLSATVNIFWGSRDDAHLTYSIFKALGWWRAYFLEPLLLFFILIGRSGNNQTDKTKINAENLIKFLIFSTVSISLLAIIQKITGNYYPPSLWNDELNGRVTAFFTSPNAIGLYLAPIIALLAALLVRKNKYITFASAMPYVFLLLIALAAIFFSYSQGAWIALIAGFVLFLVLFGYKKITFFIIITALIVSFAIPTLKQAILFQDQAGRNRLELWNFSIEYLTASPVNFVFGSGLRQFFNEVQKPHYNVKKMERLIYPHNIFLNFWLETGLLGMVSFLGILICAFYLAARLFKTNKTFGAGFLAALTIITIHGLVDVPYFKNDLSVIFWIIMTVLIVAQQKKYTTKN